MLKLSGSLTNLPIVSLRTGGKIGVTNQPIINPHKLKIEGWYCQDLFSGENLILLSSEVREIVPQGLAVNDHDAMTDPKDLIRLKEIIEFNFELSGKQVITDHKRKLGKVTDFAVDPENMMIQKIYVSRPIYKSLTEGQLSIDRSQVIEMTNRKIIVKDADIRIESTLPSTAPATS